MEKTPSPVLGSREMITLGALIREVLADERGSGLRIQATPEPPALTRLHETRLRLQHSAGGEREAVA